MPETCKNRFSLVNSSRPMKFTTYFLTQWISKLSESFEVHWIKQCLVIVKMTTKLKCNLYVRHVIFFCNFWHSHWYNNFIGLISLSNKNRSGQQDFQYHLDWWATWKSPDFFIFSLILDWCFDMWRGQLPVTHWGRDKMTAKVPFRFIRCDMAFVEPTHHNKPNITYLLLGSLNHSYLGHVTTAELWQHLSNMNVMFNI